MQRLNINSFPVVCVNDLHRVLFNPVFHVARREAKTRIRHRDWLKLAGEKIRCKQVGTVPTFLSVCVTKSPSGKRALRRGIRSLKLN